MPTEWASVAGVSVYFMLVNTDTHNHKLKVVENKEKIKQQHTLTDKHRMYVQKNTRYTHTRTSFIYIYIHVPDRPEAMVVAEWIYITM